MYLLGDLWVVPGLAQPLAGVWVPEFEVWHVYVHQVIQ